MKKILKEVLKQVIKTNNFLNKKILTEETIEKEKKKYENFLKLQSKLNNLLIVFQNTPEDDLRQGSINLMELHILMGALSSYIENLHERVMDVFKEYPVPDDL